LVVVAAPALLAVACRVRWGGRGEWRWWGWGVQGMCKPHHQATTARRQVCKNRGQKVWSLVASRAAAENKRYEAMP